MTDSPTSPVSTKPVIFVSYSHKDEPEKPGPEDVAWMTFVLSFLAPVVKAGVFDLWTDQHLHGGEVLDPAIKEKLAACDIRADEGRRSRSGCPTGTRATARRHRPSSRDR